MAKSSCGSLPLWLHHKIDPPPPPTTQKKKKKEKTLPAPREGGGAKKTQYRLVLATSLDYWGVSSNPTSCKLINHQKSVIKWVLNYPT